MDTYQILAVGFFYALLVILVGFLTAKMVLAELRQLEDKDQDE